MKAKKIIITDNQDEFLKRYKEKTGTTGNEFIRRALDSFIKRIENIWKREGR